MRAVAASVVNVTAPFAVCALSGLALTARQAHPAHHETGESEFNMWSSNITAEETLLNGMRSQPRSYSDELSRPLCSRNLTFAIHLDPISLAAGK